MFRIQVLKSIFWADTASKAYELTLNVLSSSNRVLQTIYIHSWKGINLEPNELKSYIDFQNANIQSISQVLQEKGLVGESALAYIESIIEGFSFEIWERKEKSVAATILKNQIRATVEKEKGKILPDYNPANLSKASRVSKTSKETSDDKAVAKIMKLLGISKYDAELMMKQSVADTYKQSVDNGSIPQTTEFIDCKKCGATNRKTDTECMICSSSLVECEFCKELAIKGSKICEEHSK